MAELDEIRQRVERLEKDSMRKMLVQFLVYPGILLLIGSYFSRKIEAQKLDVQRIQITQSLLPSLFSENHSQALATELIVSKVEPELADDLHKLTASYYESKVKSDISKGQVESADSIVSAAKSVGGPAAAQIIAAVAAAPQTQQAIDKFALARQKERDGFQALLNGKFAEAQQDFEQSEAAYNGYHQVYEIARVLRTSLKANPKSFDDPAAKKKILEKIIQEDYRGAPADLFLQLKHSVET